MSVFASLTLPSARTFATAAISSRRRPNGFSSGGIFLLKSYITHREKKSTWACADDVYANRVPWLINTTWRRILTITDVHTAYHPVDSAKGGVLQRDAQTDACIKLVRTMQRVLDLATAEHLSKTSSCRSSALPRPVEPPALWKRERRRWPSCRCVMTIVILCDRRGSGRSGSAAPRPSIGAPKDNTSIFSKDRET